MMLLEYIELPTFALLVITSYLIYFWFSTRRPDGMPPGPISVPIFGGFVAIGLDIGRMPQAFTAIAQKYGNIFSIQRPSGRWMVVLNDAQSYREAFLKKGEDFAGRPDKHFPVLLGIQNPRHPIQGIIWGDYCEQWKFQRRTSLKILRNLGMGRKIIENKICEETQNLITEIQKIKEEAFDPHLILNNAVANIICSLLFGERYEYDDEEFNVIQNSLDTYFDMTVKAATADSFWVMKYLPIVRALLQKHKKALGYFNSVCQKKLDARKNNVKDSEDFVGLYLQELRQNVTLEDRSFQLIHDFFSAGLETTACTLIWAFCFMSKHQDIQEKVKDEIIKKIGTTRRPSLEDRNILPYTKATTLEILRLSTTSPVTAPHETICDTELFGYKIPKGTEVWGNQWAIVRDPNIFPDPLQFKPERFLNEKGEVIRNENLIQFGLGRRSCLGEQLAKQEVFLFFAHLVQKFHFFSPPECSLPPPEGTYAITHKCPPYKIFAKPRI